MRTRGEAASAASRVTACGAARRLRRAPAGSRRRGAGGGAWLRRRRRLRRLLRLLLCLLLLRDLLLLLHLRHAEEDTASRSARAPTARWQGWCSSDRSLLRLSGCSGDARVRAPLRRRRLAVVAGGLLNAPQRADRSPRSGARTAAAARRAGRSAHSHARPAAPAAGSLHDFAQPPPHPVALDRIADLLRHREADPHRTFIAALAAPAARKPAVATLRPPAAARKSARCLSRSMAARAGCGRRQALSRLRPRARRAASTLRPPLVAMRARKAVTALAHQLARLIGPLHEVFSAGRARSAMDAGDSCRSALASAANIVSGAPAPKSAAYKGERACSSMQRAVDGSRREPALHNAQRACHEPRRRDR